MKEVTRSNMELSMPSRSRSLLREQALAAWSFRPSVTAKDLQTSHGNHNGDLPELPAWISQTSQRDMEIVTRALVRELNSRPDGVIARVSNEKNAGPFEVASSSTSSCDPGSPSQTSSVEVSDSMAAQSEAPGTPTQALSRSCNNRRSITAMNNFSGKRRSRRGNRAPITIIRADPSNFEAMVQQMTGLPLESNGRAVPSLLKPQPERLGSEFTESD